jgi:hypothetical protein
MRTDQTRRMKMTITTSIQTLSLIQRLPMVFLQAQKTLRLRVPAMRAMSNMS